MTVAARQLEEHETAKAGGVAAVRFAKPEHQAMASAAESLGFDSVTDYLRHLHQRHSATRPSAENDDTLAETHPASGIRRAWRTELGAALHGDALCHLHHAPPNSVDLVMTSPPFGLVRKKSYGNEDAHRYCDWFRPFAAGFRRVLKDDGSLVIDIGGAWKPGTPTRSLYHFELLLMLCEEYGFHLCQEHYWWNPAKLPTPAEWVNIRRVRVKDAVNCVWWLSPTPWPKASNRRVLAPYSDAMRDLLKHGYQPKRRPSGHRISTHFARDNGGAVPPNLLAVANTESNGRYQDHWPCSAGNAPTSAQGAPTHHRLTTRRRAPAPAAAPGGAGPARTTPRPRRARQRHLPHRVLEPVRRRTHRRRGQHCLARHPEPPLECAAVHTEPPCRS